MCGWVCSPGDGGGGGVGMVCHVKCRDFIDFSGCIDTSCAMRMCFFCCQDDIDDEDLREVLVVPNEDAVEGVQVGSELEDAEEEEEEAPAPTARGGGSSAQHQGTLARILVRRGADLVSMAVLNLP